MTEKSQLLQFVERIQEWHEARLDSARDIQAASKEGNTIKIIDGSGKEIEVQLTQREAMIFSMGMEAGIAHFVKLPFSVSVVTPEEDEDDEEL